MSARSRDPDEAERLLRDEPPTLARDGAADELAVDEIVTEATDAEVRAAVEEMEVSDDV